MPNKSLKHKFVNAIADGGDATVVRPSNWNDDHDLWLGYRAVTLASDTIVHGDHLSIVTYNNAGAVAVSLPAPASGNMPVGWHTILRNIGVGAVTVTGTGGATIQVFGSAQSSLVINQGDTLELYSTGTPTYIGVVHASLTGYATAASVSVAAAGTPEGRLTLVAATPVMLTNALAQTTIRYTPYVGNKVPIYDGTNMVSTTFSELSNVTTATSVGSAGPAAVAANSNYDLFVWSNAGTPTLTRGPAWTSATVRGAGTDLVMVNGIWLNNAAITNGPAAQRGTYVGTVRSDASSQINFQHASRAASGGAGIIGVWNAYNRVNVVMRVQSTASSWTYNSVTIRNKQGSPTWRVSFVSGLEEDGWLAWHETNTLNPSDNLGFAYVGYDGPGASPGTNQSFSSNAQYLSAACISLSSMNGSSLGFHYVQAGENNNGTTSNVTFFGSDGSHLTFNWRC